MSKFAAALGIEIEPVSSDNLTLSSFSELCSIYSINTLAPIKIYMPDDNVCYWVNNVWPIEDKSHIIMLGMPDNKTLVWTPSMLSDLGVLHSLKLVDAKHRRLLLLGWSKDSITLESHVGKRA